LALFNEEVTATTRQLLAGLRDPLRLTCFTQAGCHACGHVVELAGEVAALSPQLRLETRDFVADAAEAARLGVSRVPALVLAREGEQRVPVRYYGLPAGHEFGAFLRALIVLSTGRGMAGVDAAAVAPITRPARLLVFVIAACTRCPTMAYLCASIAAAQPLVSADIIDADAFPDLVKRFRVGVVPKVLVNETVEVLDVVPAATLIETIAAAP
jgi:alkyl hydroperoxide reductase subunit AhpF